MQPTYGSNLDLNLLRVFAVVAECGSVTQAASRLYLTQPAVSAALRRLHESIGAPLFARQGRGLALTSRGERLLATVQPHLRALVDAALAPVAFDAKTSDRVVRVGLSDAAEAWLLPKLCRVLEREAPRMSLISIPVQFRTAPALVGTRAVDLAVTVADDLPRGVRRRDLFRGGFTCVFDPRHAKLKRAVSESTYFAHEHVVVSYNGDLQGVVEDLVGRARRVRCSVSSFANVGAIVDGSALLATVPEIVAAEIVRLRPHLRTAKLPFGFAGAASELLWPNATDDDEACAFVREKVVAIASRLDQESKKRR